MAENSVQIDLELVTKSFEAALREATKSVDGFAKDIGDAEKSAQKSLDEVGQAGKDAGKDVADGGKKASDAWSTFKGVLGAEAVVGAFNFVKDAAVSLFNTFIVDGVKGAQEAEAQLIKLKSTLAITGEATDSVVGDFQNFAAQLQKNTKADGDAVLGQLALAKQYGLTNDQAKQVVTTAQDMAARGYDADASVKQLAESFSGQAGKLAKLNPAIRELTAEQLKSGAAAELLAAQFNGSAAAAVKTLDGATTQAQNAFGDLQEEIGFVITQNPALIAAIQQAVGLFQQATAYINENSDALKSLVAEGVQAFISAIQTAVSLGTDLNKFIQDNAEYLKALAIGVSAAALAYGAYTIAVNGSAIATAAATAAQTIFNAVLTANPIGLVIVAVGALAAGVYLLAQNWEAATALMAGFAGTALQLIIPTVNGILDSIQPLVAVFSDDLAQSIDDAKETLATKADELLAFQEETDIKLAAQKQVARDQQKAADDAANQNKLAGLQQTNAAELGLTQEQSQAKLADLQAYLTDEATKQKEADKAKKDEDKKNKDEKIKADKEFQAQLEKDRKAARAEYEKNEKQSLENLRLAQERHNEERYNAQQSLSGAIIADTRSRNSFEQANDREKVANFKSTLGEISSLQSSSNRQLFEAGKAAAIAQATVSTYQAAAVALASAPPPFNYALAAAVTVAGLLNVKKISEQSPPKSGGSFADGGIVPGSSFSGDRLQANVNSGELILNKQQQARLFKLANGENGGGSVIGDKLDALAAAIFGQPIVVEIDGEAVATAVRSQVRSGFALGGT